MANRKVFEMSFAIAGKMASNFKSTFSSASSQINSLKSDIKSLNQQYKKGALSADEYRLANEKLTSQLAKAQQAQKRLDSAMQRSRNIGKSVRGAVGTTAALGVGGAAIGAGLFLGSSIKKAMDYEAELATIQALTGSTNQQMADMNTLALKMGANTKFSALEAAQGIEELLKAGLDPATVKAGGLEAALNLATAGGLDLSEAANIMSNSLNGFRKDGLKAADAANILAGAANASSADVQSLELGLAAVGPVADGIGVSFKEVNATLAAFSNNALKSSDAGTSLKTFLQNVQPQTKQATELFQKYGLTTKDGADIFFKANGQLKDMADVAEILHKNFGKLNDQQRSNAFFNLFGSDAVRAANILFKEGADGIKKMYKEMANVTALDVAKKKMDTAAGAVEQFKGAIETLQISALMPTMPLLKQFANGMADFVTQYTPQITQAMQGVADTVKSYLNKPEIKNLPDLKSKVTFVISDLTKILGDWWNSSGSAKATEMGSKLITTFSGAIKDNAPSIASAGATVGAELGKAIASSMLDAAMSDPVAAFLIGLAAPGGVKGKALAIGIGEMWNMGTKALDMGINQTEKRNSYSMTADEQARRISANRMHIGNNATGTNNWRGGLTWVGEQGPELLNLPGGSKILSNRESLSMLQNAGSRGGDVYHINFNPVVNGGNSTEIKQALEDEREKFRRMMENFLKQKGRVSFG